MLETEHIVALRGALHARVAHLVDAARRGVDPDAAASDPLLSTDGEEPDRIPPLTTDVKIIIGFEVVHMMSGMVLKLLAFERFLEEYGEAHYGFVSAENAGPGGRAVRGNVILVQIGRRPDSRPEDYRRTHKSIVALIARINAKWGGPIVYFEVDAMPLSERIAFWSMGDVMLSSECRSGFNPAGFEFLVAQHARSRFPKQRHGRGGRHRKSDETRAPGVVIMSEFSGTSAFASGFLRVNPFHAGAMAASIHAALEMGPEQRKIRLTRDTSLRWGIDPRVTLRAAGRKAGAQDVLARSGRGGVAGWATRILGDLRASRSTDDTFLLGFGFGLGFRVSGRSRTQKSLRGRHLTDFLSGMRRAQRRLLVLTYEGVIVPCLQERRGGNLQALAASDASAGGGRRTSFAPRPSAGAAVAARGALRPLRDDDLDRAFAAESGANLPFADLCALLSELCSDPRNHVYVSGRASRGAMAHAFSRCSPRLGLIAESGYVWRAAGGAMDRAEGRDGDGGDSEWRGVRHGGLAITPLDPAEKSKVRSRRGRGARCVTALACPHPLPLPLAAPPHPHRPHSQWRGPTAIANVMSQYMYRTNGARMWEIVSFIYRYILRESCSQFASLPLTSLTISPVRYVGDAVFNRLRLQPLRSGVRHDARQRSLRPVGRNSARGRESHRGGGRA